VSLSVVAAAYTSLSQLAMPQRCENNIVRNWGIYNRRSRLGTAANRTKDTQLTKKLTTIIILWEAGLWQTISFNKGCISVKAIARLSTKVKQNLWGVLWRSD